jgi:hypothetical protein
LTRGGLNSGFTLPHGEHQLTGAVQVAQFRRLP